MNKIFSILAVGSATMLAFSSCRMNILHGEGNKTTSSPQVSSFNAIEIDVPLRANITLLEGAQPAVQISSYENIVKHIKTKIENNTLIIYSDLDETWTILSDDITAQITVPSLAALSLEGASGADVHGNITGAEFKLDISGAGSATIDNIHTDNFSTELSGAASIAVKGGLVKHASYEISGAGKIKAFPLQTEETTASISGAGHGEISASQKLNMSISGAGSIKYKGHPTVTQDVSGAGSIADAN